MKRLLGFAAVVVLSAVAAATVAAQSNPLVGTWKLNVAKSKFSPGPGPKSLTRTVVADGDGVKYTFEGTAADGTALAYSFSVHFDGKDNPVTGAMPGGVDAISAKRTDANTYEATTKKGGKVIGSSKVTVSADGKTTTVDAKGTNAKGEATHDVSVYDKQ
jgi:hypothetical protein